MDRPERWLVVSYLANVEGMTASYHVDDRLRHLQAAGTEVEVLTSVCGPRPAGWEGRWHRVLSPDPSGLRYETRFVTQRWPQPWGTVAKALGTALLLPFYLLEKAVANCEATYFWWRTAALAGRACVRSCRPDFIYSTGGPLASHAAAAAIARRSGIPWIAEIRDPLPYNVNLRGRLHRRLVPRLERLIHTHAAGVVYVTRTACERAQAHALGPAPCTAIYPGGEPIQGCHPERLATPRCEAIAGGELCEGSRPAEATGGSRPPLERSCLTLLHAGSLGGSRHPGLLLQALEGAVGLRPGMRAELRLTLLGEMDDTCRQQVAAFPCPEMVEVIGKQPRAAAQEMVAGADVLLVLQNLEPISEETIPSKTYDYLVSGKPILGLVFRNEELRTMLTEAGHQAVEATDVNAITRALLHLHAAWREQGLPTRPDTRYTRARATAELVAWARTLRNEESDAPWAEEASLAPTRKS